MAQAKNYTVLMLSFLIIGLPSLSYADPVKSLKGKKMAWFFNKPNASLDNVLRDLKECQDISQLAQDKAADAAPEDGSALLSIAWLGLLSSGRTNIDIANCMSARDYLRYEIRGVTQKDFMKKFETMDENEVSAYFTSATPPQGSLADYRPNGLLNYKATTLRASGTAPKLEPIQALPKLLKFGGPLILNKKLPPKPLTAPTALDPTKATLVTRLNFQGKSGRFDRPDLLFLKRDSNNGHFILTDDEKPIVFRIANHKPEKLVNGFQLFQVEPGQYALWQVNGHKQSDVTYTCLSTITMDLNANEKVYLGDWTYSPEDKFSVSANGKAEAQAALKSIDSASGFLSTAVFKNGADTPCTSLVGGGMPLYYFELPSVSK